MMRSSAMLLAFCTASFVQPASAETLKFLANVSIQPAFTVARDAVIDGPGGDTISKFKVKERGLVVVHFTAGCFVQGAEGAGVTVTIYVKFQGKKDFVALPPTYSGNSFCTVSSGTKVSATSTAVGAIEMPSGQHSVRVSIQPYNTGTAYLRGTSLQIEN